MSKNSAFHTCTIFRGISPVDVLMNCVSMDIAITSKDSLRYIVGKGSAHMNLQSAVTHRLIKLDHLVQVQHLFFSFGRVGIQLVPIVTN